MEVKKNCANGVCTLVVSGRLDTTTAPELEKELKNVTCEYEKMVFDFADLEYISSAGIRVVIAQFKECSAKDAGFELINVQEAVKEVFELTGLTAIITIK